MKFQIYKNLHKNCYSIREPNGRVIGHATIIEGVQAKFTVQPKGRENVLKTQRKNVHAFITAHIRAFLNFTFTNYGKKHYPELQNITDQFDLPESLTLATYNPYNHNTFIDKLNNQPLKKCDYILATPNFLFAN